MTTVGHLFGDAFTLVVIAQVWVEGIDTPFIEDEVVEHEFLCGEVSEATLHRIPEPHHSKILELWQRAGAPKVWRRTSRKKVG